MESKPRIRPTPAILYYAMIDVIGMVLFATGALWLFQDGMHLFWRKFPSTTMEAALAMSGGLFLMVISVAKILREVMTRAASTLRKDE